MIFLSQLNELQAGFYTQHNAHDLLRIHPTSSHKAVSRQIRSDHNSSTQLLHEFGTTDMAIGDATAEVIITTLGKIPNEMYYLEDTTSNGKAVPYGNELYTMLDNNHTTMTSIKTAKANEYTQHSMLLLILLTTFLIILLLCCVTACIIARSAKKHVLFRKQDIECSPECSGVNQPLLNLNKASGKTCGFSKKK